MTEKNETSTTQEAGQKKDNKAEAPRKVGTNALTLPWPSDPQGSLQALKRGGVSGAKRVNGDKEKLKRFIETLDILKAHAKERYAKDLEARNVAKKDNISAKARIEEKLRRQAEAKAQDAEAVAAKVRKDAGITKEVK